MSESHSYYIICRVSQFGRWLPWSSFAVVLISVRKSDCGRTKVALWIFVLSVGSWLAYVGSTANRILLRLSLDAEDPRTASAAYHFLIFPDIHAGLSVATNAREWGNVRFYAACKVGETLASSNEYTIKQTLEFTDNAPLIHTEFFGTNDINGSFFIPGTAVGPFAVRDVIEKRLNQIRTAGSR